MKKVLILCFAMLGLYLWINDDKIDSQQEQRLVQSDDVDNHVADSIEQNKEEITKNNTTEIMGMTKNEEPIQHDFDKKSEDIPLVNEETHNDSQYAVNNEIINDQMKVDSTDLFKFDEFTHSHDVAIADDYQLILPNGQLNETVDVVHEGRVVKLRLKMNEKEKQDFLAQINGI